MGNTPVPDLPANCRGRCHGNASARARGDLCACTGLGVGPVVLIP